MKTKIISILTLIVLSTSFVGCKKFLDVNKNPNISDNPTVENILPSAQVSIASTMGVQFQINGSFWAQHWTQSPLANQYKNYDQYQVSSDNYNTPWTNLYAGALTDLKFMYNKAKSEDKKQYMAISLLLSAYTFHVLTDAFGDIPFSEALKGSIADGSIISPKYDKQEDVYTGILKMIAEADGYLDPLDPGHPTTDDLIYGGEMQNWIEFSNTLKLKIYLRLSEKQPEKASAGIATLQGKDFLTKTAKVSFVNKGGSQNPLYSEMVGLSNTTNIFASKTCVGAMSAYDDPRMYVFYTPLGNGTVVGLTQGDFANSNNAAGKSIGGPAVGANPNDVKSATAPVVLISLSESEYLQAEAIARTWLSGDDKAHYQKAFIDGVKDYEISILDQVSQEHIDLQGYDTLTTTVEKYASDILANEAVLEYPTSQASKIERIITQKWIGMSGNQGFEAWTEWRRTGFPVFNQSVASLIGAGNFPQRFLYPTNEINRNINFPGTKLVTEKVWWDAN